MTDPIESRLPYEDELGFCNISMVALGGDGANSLGKMLFDIAVMVMNLDGGYDAAYGSEKKGTPTSVSIKLCEVGRKVREVGPTKAPHILVVFREHLLESMVLNRGLQKKATVIVNTLKTPEEIRERLRLHSGKIICFDATDIATRTKSRINIPLFAVLAHTLGFPDDMMIAAIEKSWPRAKVQNLAAYQMAASETRFQNFPADGRYPLVPYDHHLTGAIGWDNQNEGSYIENTEYLNMRSTKPMRAGQIPIFKLEPCINCVKCFFTCPDPGSIVYRDGQMIGIDYDFCKGCLRCVTVCPETKKGHALVTVKESDYAALVTENPVRHTPEPVGAVRV
jgi:pyruvate ferredoxin oxidoreductase gamma subunit